MASLLQVFKEQEIKNFDESYKNQVHDLEMNYRTAKKAYERALKRFVKKNITYTSHDEVYLKAYGSIPNCYKPYLRPDQLDALVVLVGLHRCAIQYDDFYEGRF